MKYPAIILSLLVAAPAFAQQLNLTSPDGRNTISFSKNGKELRYSVHSDGKPVILDSRAGLEMDNEIWEKALGKRTLAQPDSWMELLTVDSVSYASPVDTTWKPLFGERAVIPDRYNQATLHMSRHDESKYRLDVQVRAYDEGVAFRYFLPEHPDAIFHKVVGDLTDYAFPQGTMAWSEQWAQAPFVYSDVDSISTVVERPLTLLLPSGKWAALLDADVDDWCLTKFRRRPGLNSTLESVMYSPVDVVTYCAAPWKLIMLADTPGELIEHNYMVDNLNPAPEEGKDFSWVKPGKIMRCTKLTTEAAIENIDFCAAHNIPYMLYDWKWYEPCTSHDGDATKVIPAIDMAKVVSYGKEKGVGIWLYVNQHALAKQMDELFPLLSKWGVAGVKSGFVQYASHRWATWLHDMVRKAADNGLLMNIHDEFRPSGFSRTYPNLLTQEGIHGNEEWPDGKHNVTLPFTRMLCGAADYTICYFDKRLKNTHAHQLAASLVYYSPLMTILWYDTPDRYHGEPEIKWFEDLETTFDESRVLSGYPGRNITMARRKGDIWWVGAMTDNNGHREEIDLSFLTPGKKYTAEIYTDGGDKVKTATHVATETRKVNSKSKLSFDIMPKGGVAIRIIPD